MLGEARSKFATVAGPQGGTSMNGDALKQEAAAELEKLEQDLLNYTEGGLPLSFYLLPMKLDRRRYVATLAIVFLTLNLFKMVPYAYLGQINFDNLITSLLLLPLAPLGVYLGAYLTERVSQEIFYSITHFCLILTGTKLIYDGLTLGTV